MKERLDEEDGRGCLYFHLGAEKGEILGQNVGLGENLGLSTRGPSHAKLSFLRSLSEFHIDTLP